MRTIMAIITLLALFILPSATTLDGTTRSYSGQGAMHFRIGKRSVALLLVPYRPGRVYYQCRVSAPDQNL